MAGLARSPCCLSEGFLPDRGGALLFAGDDIEVALPAAAAAAVVDALLPLYARQRSANDEKNDVGAGLGGISACCRGSGGEGVEAIFLASIDSMENEVSGVIIFSSSSDLLWK